MSLRAAFRRGAAAGRRDARAGVAHLMLSIWRLVSTACARWRSMSAGESSLCTSSPAPVHSTTNSRSS